MTLAKTSKGVQNFYCAGRSFKTSGAIVFVMMAILTDCGLNRVTSDTSAELEY